MKDLIKLVSRTWSRKINPYAFGFGLYLGQLLTGGTVI